MIILKGHLLMEEQLRVIIEERIPGHAALLMSDGSRWTFDLKARLAEALCYGEEHESLWRGIRKLNKIRDPNHFWPVVPRIEQIAHGHQVACHPWCEV